MASNTVPLGVYIWKRLASLGIEHVFGVPGDFNLNLLDQIYDVPELTWLGTCNELNGAYAADGYARIKGHPAALLTTYGVGELSAMNGVAGAYAEHAGMIHLVGMTSRHVQKNRVLIHHTMKPGMDHAIYIGMSEPVRATHAYLMEDAKMAEEIDRVIIEGVKSRLPVFIYIPMDVVQVQLDAKRLETKLDTRIFNESVAEDEVVKDVLQLIRKAEKPAILADVLTIRHGGRDLARELVDLTQFQAFSTPLSKGVIDETHPSYGGNYNGTVSFPGVAEAIHTSDLVLNIGPLLSDSNTGAFTRDIKETNLVLLAHDFCQVGSKKYENIHFLPVLARIVSELKKSPKSFNIPKSTPLKLNPPVLNALKSGKIEQSYVWQRLGKFLKPDDIVLAESGTAQFGIPDATFPSNVQYITQIFWSSIGYTVGGCLGALVAAKETKHPGRVVLLVGEGSLQMTAQEIGSYIRFGFTPIIFVINNNGYSIERAINGPTQRYNEVSMLWDHQKMLEFFGAREETGIKSRSWKCETVESLEEVLEGGELGRGDVISVCEIVMEQYDYPWRLTKQVEITKGRVAALAAAAAGS
ncbi:Pyruvate decarboxylase [Hyphodiscus hymeniophilus]|uniref:Pyruvate decarboxylase n=1 Tax=Hyphodiscus hymeniophilus TaxID=353542 RepID=A0A9P6VNG3_9HELO|nr:Pyruvate decarboxylase [Hyphodiscus hymeniophilus]